MKYYLTIDNFETRAIFNTYPQARDYCCVQARMYYSFASEFYHRIPQYFIRIYEVSSKTKTFYPNYMKLIEIM